MLKNNACEKLRKEIINKLVEHNAYIDNELPDYIIVMIANKKTPFQMKEDLKLFIGSDVDRFVDWLSNSLDKLNNGEYFSDENNMIEKKNLQNQPNSQIEDKKDIKKFRKIIFNNSEKTNLVRENDYLKKKVIKKIVFNKNESDKLNSSIDSKVINHNSINRKRKENLINTSKKFNILNVNSTFENEKNMSIIKTNKLIIKAIDDANKSTVNLNNFSKRTLNKKNSLENNDIDKQIKSKFLYSKLFKISIEDINSNNLNVKAEENQKILDPLDLRHILIKKKQKKESQLLKLNDKTKYEIVNKRGTKTKLDKLLHEKLLHERILHDQLHNLLHERISNKINNSYLKFIEKKFDNKIMSVRNENVKIKFKKNNNKLLLKKEYLQMNKFKKDIILNKKERCYFWPTCQNGDKCSFHHPKFLCMKFPSCKFKDSCLNIHPNCKFDSKCVKKNCPYSHYSKKVQLFKVKRN